MKRVREQIGLRGSGGKGIVIAVLDTGVADHPDLRDKVVYFRDFVGDSHNMYDDNSHGTHICGILCGSGEMSGGTYRGIADQGSLVVCKVLDREGNGSAGTMLRALEFIGRYGSVLNVRIVNVSVGISDLKDEALLEKLRRELLKLWQSGIVVVCAAGNKGPADGSISSLCGSSKVITVGCHDGSYFSNERDRCELYSGRGSRFGTMRKPDVVAPGTHIVSCNALWSGYSGYTGLARGSVQGAPYTEKSGTSMAAPIVSGCAARLLEREPWLSPDQVRERILYTARDLGEEWNKQGWGMINAKRLLEIE